MNVVARPLSNHKWNFPCGTREEYTIVCQRVVVVGWLVRREKLVGGL